MRFIFLRHSAYQQPEGVPSAMLPHALTQEGLDIAQQKASEMVTFFKNKQDLLPRVIETSVLLRAFQTAEIIQQAFEEAFGLKIPITQTERLMERKVGSVANLTVQEIEKIIAQDPRFENPPKGWKSQSDYRLPFPDCESLLEAGRRVFEYIRDGFEDERYRVIVGHGASFRHAAVELGVLTMNDIPKLSMHYAEPLYFENQKGWKLIKGAWKIRARKENID